MNGRGSDFSQKIIVYASVMYALTWAVAVGSWFVSGATPEKLLEYSTALCAAEFVVYGGKAAYETKARIAASAGRANGRESHGDHA